MPKRTNEKESESAEGAPCNKIAPMFLPRIDATINNPIHGVWKVTPDEIFVFTPNNAMENREKVAGFDMDGTLIKTISGRVFAKDNDDWQLWDKTAVPREMQRLHDDGFKLCIFTNQKGIQTKAVDPNALKRKIQAIISLIGLPIQAFVSVGSANYRKPYTGMWDKMESAENGGVIVNRSECLYVGDAAGRTQSKTHPKADHSVADRLFALNLGIKFQTPEQFFLKRSDEQAYKLPPFRASLVVKSTDSLFEPAHVKVPGANPEMLVFVGPPASGKSTLASRLAAEHKQYAVVNQDEMKTWKACVQAANEHLVNRRSVIVDCTNRDPETRARYLELAKSLSVPCRCFIVKCSFEMARHNNTFRRIAFIDAEHKDVNDMVLRMFFKAYKAPTMAEGFDEIAHVNFLPSFKEEKHRRIYEMHLLEK